MAAVECQTCHKSFKNEAAYQQHARNKRHPTASATVATAPAVALGAHGCTTCRVDFASQLALQQHYRASNAHPSCSRCLEAFKDQHQLTTHLALVHLTRCERCNLSVYRDELRQHYTSSPNHPSCVVCAMGYENESVHDAHVASSHPELLCAPCARVFRSTKEVQQHYRSSSAHPGCMLCSVGYKDTAAYDEHVASSHPELRCVPCARSFQSAEGLQEHYGISSAHIVCVACNVGFKDNVVYDNHIVSSHPDLRCRPCARMFQSTEGVQEHYRNSSAHPLCTMCDVGFKDIGVYNEHIASSHPELYCAPCSRTFQFTEAIQSHYKDSLAHPLCTLCNVGFKDDTVYNEHMASFHPPPPMPLVVETSTPQVIQTFIEESTPTPRSGTVELVSAPFTPRSRQSMNLTLATELPTPATDVSQFRHSLLGESSQSSPAALRAASEPTLPSASSLRAGSGAVSQTPTSPAMTERTLEYIRSSALRAGNVILRLSRSPSPAMSRSFSLRGLRRKRSESVSSESLQSLHSSDVDSNTKSPDFDALSLPGAELPTPIQALLTPAEIDTRGAKTPEPRSRPDVERTPTRMPDPPSSHRSAVASEILSRRGESQGSHRESLPAAPTPLRSNSKGSRLSSLRRSMSVVSRLSAHGVSDESDMTVREPPKSSEDSSRTPAASKGLSWHCRSCHRDPCCQPTATMCGHIFCNSCIMRELSDNMQCPVCKKTMLLRLHVEAD